MAIGSTPQTEVDMRHFVMSWLRETTPLAEAQQILFQDSSLVLPKQLPDTRPFLLYRFGSMRPTIQGGDQEVAMVQTIYLQVHDRPGDFYRVDRWLNDWVFRLGGPDHVNSLTPQLRKEFPFIVHVSLDYASEDLTEPDWDTVFRQLRLYAYLRNPYS